jgi:hypothetical protein
MKSYLKRDKNGSWRTKKTTVKKGLLFTVQGIRVKFWWKGFGRLGDILKVSSSPSGWLARSDYPLEGITGVLVTV